MRNRRPAIAALALATLLGLAGCNDAGTRTASETPSGAGATTAAAKAETSADAKAALAAAAGKLADTSMKVGLEMAGTMSMSMKGVAEPKAGLADMSMSVAGTDMQFRQVGEVVYLKIAGGGTKIAEGKWMRMDVANLKGGSMSMLGGKDPAGAQALVNATTKVENDGPNGFKGVIDLSKSPTYNEEQLKALGSKATEVPFKATTDAEGRLVKLELDMNQMASGAGTMTATYSDFGAPVDVKAPPAAEVVEAPAEITNQFKA